MGLSVLLSEAQQGCKHGMFPELPLTIGNIGCDSFRIVEVIWQLQRTVFYARWRHYRVFSEVYLECKYGLLKSCEYVILCESMK